jgi:hypothetical protein
MTEATYTVTPLPGVHQPLPACPFWPPLGNIPLIRLPGRRSTIQHAPWAAMLTSEVGTNLVLPRIQGWCIPAQASMPGIAYDLRGTNPNHGADHG